MQSLDVNNYLIFEQDILGSNGRLRILNSGAKIEYYKISDSKYFAGYKELEISEPPFTIPEKREFMIEGIEELVNSVETGARPISSGEDGLQDLEVILALVSSAEDDSKKVYLPPR